MEDANECGIIQIRPTRGNAPGGFYPDTKNCNLGEKVIIKNKHPGIQQTVSCRITPDRSFICNAQQLKKGCRLPPYYSPGSFACYSAMPGNQNSTPFKNKIIVNGNTTDVYDDNGPLMYPT